MKRFSPIMWLGPILLIVALWNFPKEPQVLQVPIVKIAQETKTIKLTKYISKHYHISTKQAFDIVVKANKHSAKIFPKTEDILAVIAVESRFEAHAIFSTNAVGLMQIVYKKSSTNIEQNIRDGSTLLKTYYRLTKSKDAAIQSYNIGIGSYYSGLRSAEYLEKVKKHTQKFKEIK